MTLPETPKTREELIDAVARHRWESEWDQMDEGSKIGIRVAIEAHIQGIEAAGVRLVPAEPTDLMCIYADGTCGAEDPENIELTRNIIKAALLVSPFAPKEGSAS